MVVERFPPSSRIRDRIGRRGRRRPASTNVVSQDMAYDLRFRHLREVDSFLAMQGQSRQAISRQLEEMRSGTAEHLGLADEVELVLHAIEQTGGSHLRWACATLRNVKASDPHTLQRHAESNMIS